MYKFRNAINVKTTLKYILKFGVSALLLYWILKDTNFHDILAAMDRANRLLLVFSFLLHIVGLYISAQRWRLLLGAQNIGAEVFHLMKSYLVAIFFNHFLPSTVGGDAMRAYDSYKLGKNKANAVTVVFIDRFLGLFALATFGFVAVFFAERLVARMPYINLWVSLIFLCAFTLILNVFFPNKVLLRWIADFSIIRNIPKVKSTIEKVGDAFLHFQGSRLVLLKGLSLSVALQTNVVIYYFLIATAMGFQIPFHYFFLIVPVSLLIMILPISLNGIGLRENAFFFFFATFGVNKADAVAFVWIELGMVLIYGILGGIIYALRK